MLWVVPHTDAGDDVLLTSTEAGLLVNRSGRTIVRWALADRLPIARRLPGPNGALLFRKADVLAMADANAEGAA